MLRAPGLRSAGLVAAMVAGMATSGVSATDNTTTPTVISLESNAVRVNLGGQAETWSLTVVGPNGYRTETEVSAANGAVFISSGDLHEDGQYQFELRSMAAALRGSEEDLAALREQMDTASDEDRQALRLDTPESDVVSGTFTVLYGSIVTDAKEAPAAGSRPRATEVSSTSGTDTTRGQESPTRDQQILDDLIVDGSACVGQDCVNGESFGFDTVRLKENNLRIRFFDTSSSGSFPTVDWQLTANDTANGGANKFSIDDIDTGKTPFTILSGAPTNALFVDAAGEVGLGTSTPVVSLHVVDGDSPTLRLEQNGSSGFTPQTWDVAGNEANFFVRDATNGSRLPFKIRPNSPTDSMVMESSRVHFKGTPVEFEKTATFNVGTAASAKIDVKNGNAIQLGEAFISSGDNFLHLSNNNWFDNSVWSAPADAGRSGVMMQLDRAHIAFYTSDASTPPVFSQFMSLGDNPQFPGQSLTMNPSGAHVTTGGVWTDASSRDLKDEIAALDTNEALATLRNLEPVKYRYKQTDDERHVGFIAEDVPDLVATKNRKGVAPMDIVAVLTKVVQEQQRQIEELNAKLDSIQSQNAEPTSDTTATVDGL